MTNKVVQQPLIKIFDPDSWGRRAAKIVHHQVELVLNRCGCCNILLTGGSSAKKMYAAWACDSEFLKLKNVNFYFGDERCVVPGHPESNYGMAVNTLFKFGIPEGCAIHRIEAESKDLEAAADRYAATLPRSIDILLLGVGEDGHIASLFPYSSALYENKRRVLPIVGPKWPNRRLTITPPVIFQARTTVVLACGSAKASLLREALHKPNMIDTMPACLALGGMWLLDTSIYGLNVPISCRSETCSKH